MLINDNSIPVATEEDLVSTSKALLQTPTGTKQLPGNCVAPKSVQDSLVDGEKILNASVSSVISMDGNGTTAVIQKIYAAPGRFVTVVPSKTTWAVTSLSSATYKLAVRSFNSSGTNTDIYVALASSSVFPEIKVYVPADSVYLDILFRADVGENVGFVVSVKDVPSLCITHENFEMGNISMSASSLTYGQPNTSTGARFRTKVDKTISLNAGDAIFAKSGYEFYVAESADGASPYSVKGWIKKYYASSSVKVHLLVRKTPEAATTFDDLSNAFVVLSNTSDILLAEKVDEVSESSNVVDLKKTSVTFGGSGMSEWQYDFYLPKGTLVKITHNGGNWADSSLSNSAAKFAIRRGMPDGSNPVDIKVWIKSDAVPSPILVYMQDSYEYLNLFFRANSGVEVKFDIEVMNNYQIFKQSKVGGINHRGFNKIAPENTLPAFKLSAQKGFSTVETDVCTTSDGYIVCIHDTTVDRTSNGTGYVRDKTLAELKALDFGSWKSAEYAGTTIPTLEEFIALCRNLGLSAYIEIKECDPEQLMHELEGLGALDFVTIIAISTSALTYVATNYPQIRCGYVSSTFTASELSSVLALRALSPNVFVDLQEQTGESLQRIKDNHLPYEGWVFSRSRMLAADPYMSGFTSDDINAKQVFFEENLF